MKLALASTRLIVSESPNSLRLQQSNIREIRERGSISIPSTAWVHAERRCQSRTPSHCWVLPVLTTGTCSGGLAAAHVLEYHKFLQKRPMRKPIARPKPSRQGRRVPSSHSTDLHRVIHSINRHQWPESPKRYRLMNPGMPRSSQAANDLMGRESHLIYSNRFRGQRWIWSRRPVMSQLVHLML